jgi:hypothetical protein
MTSDNIRTVLLVLSRVCKGQQSKDPLRRQEPSYNQTRTQTLL